MPQISKNLQFPVQYCRLLKPFYTLSMGQFMGKWHDIAVASTCPWMQRHKGDAAIGTLELQASGTEGKVSMTRSKKKHGTCKQISGDYELTDTPGRFTYHVAKWGADVDAYVVHTDYDKYAIVMMSKQKTGGEKTKSAKLYSRTMELPPTILDDFRRLGSGDDTMMFRSEAACRLPVDVWPCTGQPKMWVFHSNSGLCLDYKKDYCQVNSNKFYSKRESLSSISPPRLVLLCFAQPRNDWSGASFLLLVPRVPGCSLRCVPLARRMLGISGEEKGTDSIE
ncbi:unnamed protein product [Coregonus sp. 'balchen']|nr:unnamed protein product [Coregonus sp. 'balchen']